MEDGRNSSRFFLFSKQIDRLIEKIVQDCLPRADSFFSNFNPKSSDYVYRWIVTGIYRLRNVNRWIDATDIGL